MKRLILRIVLFIVSSAIIVFGAFLGYVSLTDYKPNAVEPLLIRHPVSETISLAKPFSITTFNIGYGGLDASQDFFMDGGTMSGSSSLAQTKRNIEAITATMNQLNSDIYLLQEVDVVATRSHQMDEVNYFIEKLPEYSSVFAYNYKTPWVPIPITKPMGRAESGLLSLSKFHIDSQTRYDLPGKESWPVQLFELDRAFVEMKLPVRDGKELILLNLHLSAYDKGGTIRKQQLDFLSQYIEQQIAAGNYLIIGGDWNHTLPGTDSAKFPTTQTWPKWLQKLPEDFTPKDFKWAVNSDVPTVRTIDIPYSTGVNFLAVIDGFLVSPNVEVINVSAENLQFAHSDHNPVTATFKLKSN